MATVEDLPEDLRPLGRRVPAETRANTTVLEFRIRCEEASALLAEAETVSNDDKARRLKADANKVLTAMSLATYMAEQARLCNAIDAAKERGGSYEVEALVSELRRLERENPIPVERFVSVASEVIAAEIERRANAKPRWLKRIFKRGSK